VAVTSYSSTDKTYIIKIDDATDDCGDGQCQHWETHWVCLEDCDMPPKLAYCPDINTHMSAGSGTTFVCSEWEVVNFTEGPVVLSGHSALYYLAESPGILYEGRGSGSTFLYSSVDNGFYTRLGTAHAGGATQSEHMHYILIPWNNADVGVTAITEGSEPGFYMQMDVVPEEDICGGCRDGRTCQPIGTRKESTYCDGKSWQSFATEQCEDHYECETENCWNGACSSPCNGCFDDNGNCIPLGKNKERNLCQGNRELRTPSLFEWILSWFT